ncbi:MAG: sigma-70 family RNA polymerase sigma factor [Ruminococcaceae bacterium]|nr:sigma-70 family RNA polymerase sigma factor [Oscillospiraceae bacterium]
MENYELQAITEEYYDEIYIYCRRRVRTDQIAEDITQEVFLALSERFKTIGKSAVRMWLYRTAAHKVDDHYRDSYKDKEYLRDVEIEDLEEDEPALIYDQFAELSEEEIDEAVEVILENLPPDDRLLYHDRYIAKLSCKELAKKHKLTDSVARKRLSRLHNKVTKIIFEFF